MREDSAVSQPSRERERLLRRFDSMGVRDELGLRLRDPQEEMPWITKEVAPGSWLHWHWTAFHAMYPGESWHRISALARQDTTGVEDALVFLETDPWCFRSGYAKQTIVRLLRHVPLTDAQRDRLLASLLKPVVAGPRWEFREYCKTARAFSTPEFEGRLRILAGQLQHPAESGEQQRARWMLEKILRK
ncbi:MAG: hypothetical protein AB7N24_18755 [Dehalococcoidia bacterium]